MDCPKKVAETYESHSVFIYWQMRFSSNVRKWYTFFFNSEQTKNIILIWFSTALDKQIMLFSVRETRILEDFTSFPSTHRRMPFLE